MKKILITLLLLIGVQNSYSQSIKIVEYRVDEIFKTASISTEDLLKYSDYSLTVGFEKRLSNPWSVYHSDFIEMSDTISFLVLYDKKYYAVNNTYLKDLIRSKAESALIVRSLKTQIKNVKNKKLITCNLVFTKDRNVIIKEFHLKVKVKKYSNITKQK